MIHQPEDRSFRRVARMPIPTVVNAAAAATNATASAISPRLAQPTSETGVK